MSAKKCAICGKPSGMYPLCFVHMRMMKDGKVIKNGNGEWVLKDDSNAKATKEAVPQETTKCIICGAESNGKPICLNCYHHVIDLKDSFDKNKTLPELKEYYYNLKSSCYRMVNFEFIKSNIQKLFSLAYLTNDLYKNDVLLNRVNEDAAEIIKAKQSQKEVKSTPLSDVSDSQKAYLIRTIDGHMVQSSGEEVIDNILYGLLLPHVYEKDVSEIGVNERKVKSDWFVPLVGKKGVYIEYWGMQTEDYMKNEKIKKDLYEKYNVRLIEIKKDEVKDPSILAARLERELNSFRNDILKLS